MLGLRGPTPGLRRSMFVLSKTILCLRGPTSDRTDRYVCSVVRAAWGPLARSGSPVVYLAVGTLRDAFS